MSWSDVVQGGRPPTRRTDDMLVLFFFRDNTPTTTQHQQTVWDRTGTNASPGGAERLSGPSQRLN